MSYKLVGMRTTSRRKLLLDLIQQAGGHLDADELYRQAREYEPTINLSTVYRNLRLFKNQGLIEERHFDEQHHHYEAKDTAEHHHLVCSGCGKVIEFVSPLTRQIKQQVQSENDFIVTETEIRMNGYCSQCRQNND